MILLLLLLPDLTGHTCVIYIGDEIETLEISNYQLQRQLHVPPLGDHFACCLS